MAENTLITSNSTNWKTNCCSHHATGFPGALDHRSTWKHKRKQGIDKWHVQKHAGRLKVTCCSQGKGLTVTSACDLRETCHLGLYLLHAVITQGMALPQQAHAYTKFHHCFQHSQRQSNFSAYFTPRRAIKIRSWKTPLPCDGDSEMRPMS